MDDLTECEREGCQYIGVPPCMFCGQQICAECGCDCDDDAITDWE